MDTSTLTAVIGTLCGVIAFLYKREAARADRLESKLNDAETFQRNDMVKMLNWYARATLDYSRILRGEMPHDALDHKKSEETTQIINNAGSKGHKK